MNRIILICATIFVFIIGAGCASATDLNVAGDAPALDVVDQIGPDVQLRPDVVDRPDVQMSASLEHSGKAADYKDKPIIAFQDDENSPLQLRPDVVDDVSASQIRPDVQKVYVPEKYTDLEKEQNRPIASFWDRVFPFDILNNMTDEE